MPVGMTAVQSSRTSSTAIIEKRLPWFHASLTRLTMLAVFELRLA